MRPNDLPRPEKFPHGTRARYVTGCRCDACRDAIRRAERERARRVREAAAEVEPNPGPVRFKTIWRTRRRDGTRYQVDLPACPGTGGKPCVVPGGASLKGLRVCLACVNRAVVWNGLVDAAPVRAHLRKLQRAGVGHKSVAAACDVAATVLGDVLWGGKKRIRKHTADRVLAVTAEAAADGARIDARPTWKLIDEMLEAGLTRTAISRGIGHEQAVLCIGRDQVQAKTALKVRQLHARVMAQGERRRFPRDPADPRFVHPAALAEVLEQLRELGIARGAVKRHLGYQLVKPRCTPGTLRKLCELRDRTRHQAEVDARAERFREIEQAPGTLGPRVCPDCGCSHAQEDRLEVLRRMLPCPAEELRAAHPCWWTTPPGDARLSRDLRAVGAVKIDGVWTRAPRAPAPGNVSEAAA